ncbi:hypothetical protein COCNU_02G018400 [Cocos nucifera]|uniref:Uncharacterized protein n=1 Tax=Cocos nucifera TaxID=13894 RepID=A0A8K0I1D4_COCNU|nr:hypothetical protein COCNU_02G018400 [Cocos nucifera]
MFPEDSNNSRSLSKKKRRLCLPSCFVGSLVSDSGGSDRSGPSTGSKPKLSWFTWSRFRKKKKTVPIEEASSQKISPSDKPFKGR